MLRHTRPTYPANNHWATRMLNSRSITITPIQFTLCRNYLLAFKSLKFWRALWNMVKALFVCGLDNKVCPNEYTWVI
jgi:hypothetical protein